MRWYSSILFALMVAVLPTAGMQKYFCTLNMSFVESAQDCPAGAKDCCNKDHGKKPVAPDCMVGAKVLPDAERSTPMSLPSVDSVWILLPVPGLEVRPPSHCGLVAPEGDRGPPDGSRLFLAHSRMLI